MEKWGRPAARVGAGLRAGGSSRSERGGRGALARAARWITDPRASASTSREPTVCFIIPYQNLNPVYKYTGLAGFYKMGDISK